MTSQKTQAPFKTSIGGQALIEGIMMRGPKKYALAVRKPNGEIVLEETPYDRQSRWYSKVPFVRGCFQFVSSLVLGYHTLMRSAELSEQMDEQETQKEMGLLGILSAVLAVILSLVLFMILPTIIVGFVSKFVSLGRFATALESVLKIAIFVGYIALISHMKEIQRVFQYHGAEHKTIACYEHGEELTVENVKNFSRFHPRCGTSFLIITMLVSILIFMFISWDNLAMRVLLKVLLLPIVMGITYEIIKFAGKHDNLFTRIISAPGLWLQRLTVKEPQDDMIEVAIKAITAVIPPKKEDAQW